MNHNKLCLAAVVLTTLLAMTWASRHGEGMLRGNEDCPVPEPKIVTKHYLQYYRLVPDVLLDGSKSRGPWGWHISGTLWNFKGVPSGSRLRDADIVPPSSDKVSFTPDMDGEYTVILTVLNECGALATHETTVEVRRTDIDPEDNAIVEGCPQPLAFAGMDRLVETSQESPWVLLDGSDSYDPQGNGVVEWEWKIFQQPHGSRITIDEPHNNVIGFVPHKSGLYKLELTVWNDCGSRDDDVIEVEVVVIGTIIDPTDVDEDGDLKKDDDKDEDYVCFPPAADAGADQVLQLGEFAKEVALDGTKSHSLSVEPLTEYQWEFYRLPRESRLSSADIGYRKTPLPSFFPDVDGVYGLRLTVSNSCGTDASDDTEVVVRARVRPHDDPEEDEEDHIHESGGDSTCLPPSVSAGQDLDLDHSYLSAQLVGQASAAGPDFLTGYHWSFVRRPQNSQLVQQDIQRKHDLYAEFSPDVPGIYELQLSVVTSCGSVATDYVLVVVEGEVEVDPWDRDDGEREKDCTQPTAVVGDDVEVQYANPAPVISFDGLDSHDENHLDITGYLWSFRRTPMNSVLSDEDIFTPDQPMAGFVPDVPGVYEVQLLVVNECGSISTDYLLCIVTAGDEVDVEETETDGGGDHCPMPSPHAGEDIEVVLPTSPVVVTAHESSSPMGHEIIGHRWSFTRVPESSVLRDHDISNAGDVHATFQPDVAGVYELKVIVVNDCGQLGKDYVLVFVHSEDERKEEEDDTQDTDVLDCTSVPTAYAGEDLEIELTYPRQVVHLNGLLSDDEEGFRLTSFIWKLMRKPSDSTMSSGDIVDKNKARAHFVPDKLGEYVIQLLVENECGKRDTSSFLLIVREPEKVINDDDMIIEGCEPPVADAGENMEVVLENNRPKWVVLDGTKTFDPQKSHMRYEWSFGNHPGATWSSMITPKESSLAGFLASVVGGYSAILTVTNDCGSSAVDEVLIYIRNEGVDDSEYICPHVKVDAGDDIVVERDLSGGDSRKAFVVLDGRRTLENDSTYPITSVVWRFARKPSDSELTDDDIAYIDDFESGFAADVGGSYDVELVVQNSCGTESVDIVNIVVRYI